MNRESLAYSVAEILLKHLPEGLDQGSIEAIAADLVLLAESAPRSADDREGRRLAVITSVGKNRTGIIHGISEILTELNVDIVDIDQTLVRDNFAMMMVVDPTDCPVDFQSFKERLKARGQELGVGVFVQYEDLLRAVNRI